MLSDDIQQPGHRRTCGAETENRLSVPTYNEPLTGGLGAGWGQATAEPLDDGERAAIKRATRLLAEQAVTTVSETSRRIQLYARFQNLRPIDVSHAILAGTVRLLTIQETDDLEHRTAAPGDGDHEGDTVI